VKKQTKHIDLNHLNMGEVKTLNREDFKLVMSDLLTEWAVDKKENAILHYKPVTDTARRIHTSTKQTIGVGGGNGSSKTETCFAEIVACATGCVPLSLRDDPNIDWKKKLRGPIRVRVVCESLTNVLANILLPKLKWWEWTGVDLPGGERGHWGWVPKNSLIHGSWEKSWSEKYRTLQIKYHNTLDPNDPVGVSTIQFMSRDQDSSDFASGDFHIVMHDEPPTYAIWRENQARTMRVRGRMMLAMTWPDDPSIPVDWIFDEVYEPGEDTTNNTVDWINLYTTDNPNLDQEAIKIQESQWDEQTSNVRLRGQPIRFSNRVHQLFTDQTQTWCFACGRTVIAHSGKCGRCESSTIVEFNHVGDHPPAANWPTIYLVDPHPRKPHMMAWWQVTPQDDLVQVAEAVCEGDPTDVRLLCDAVEGDMGLSVSWRYIDPNMGRSPASSKRGVTWQDEFDTAGLHCDLADDSGVGRKRIDEYLKPDPHTLAPRIAIDSSCTQSIFQMKRFVWDDYRKTLERDLKQIPKPKNDDFPTLTKYLLNSDPSFTFAAMGAPIFRKFQNGSGATQPTQRRY